MSSTKVTKAQKVFAARLEMLRAHRLAATSRDMVAVLGGAKGASPFEFTQAVSDAIDEMKIDVTSIFATDRNPKCIKRFIQFIHGINAKSYKNIDRTTATIIYALKLTEGMPLTTDALHYIGAGLKEGKIAPECKGISRMQVNRLFGSVKVATIPTQCSRTVGKNGFLQLAGATVGEPGKVNQKVQLVADHPMIARFIETMNSATAGQIDEVTGQADSE
jgi:hypothetical protein